MADAPRRWRALPRQRRGVVALEFALCAVPLLLMVLGTIEVGYGLLVQSALDYSLGVAAREIRVGTLQGTSGETGSAFATTAICPTLSLLVSCSQVIVAVAPIATGYDFYSNPSPLSFTTAANGTGSLCTGTAGQMVVMQAWYIGPTFVLGLVPAFSQTYNGSTVHITTASAGFVNEAFTGGQTTGTGC